MSKLTKRQLQSTINKMTASQTTVFQMQQLLDAHCEEVYGCTPSSIDNDWFIDSCMGGTGTGISVSADEFHKSMLDAMHLAGVEFPKPSSPDL